jgi:peptidoglycan/LPS O-acetylase OafA/YrhL
VSSQPRPTNNFDSLRLILAVLVILSHAFPLSRGSNDTEPLYELTRGQTTLGNLSVWGFFAISGFLITQSWTRSPKVAGYLRRRIGRIYPGFIVLALLSVLILAPLAAGPGHRWSTTPWRFIADTLRLQSFDMPPVFEANPSPNALNGSLWSIPYEFWCYIMVMVFGLLGLLRRRWFLVALLVEVVGLHAYLDWSGWHPGGKLFGEMFGYPLFWVTVLPFFLAGMIFNLWGGKALFRADIAAVSFLLLVVSYFVPYGAMLALPTVGAYALLWLAQTRRLNFLHLGRYGDFSYGVYLYAYPIEQFVQMYSGGRMSPLLLFCISAPLSLAAGAASWFLVEKHFLSKSARLKHEGVDVSSAGKELLRAVGSDGRGGASTPR